LKPAIERRRCSRINGDWNDDCIFCLMRPLLRRAPLGWSVVSILAGQIHTSANGWVPTRIPRIRRTKGTSKFFGVACFNLLGRLRVLNHDMTSLAREATALSDALPITYNRKYNSNSKMSDRISFISFRIRMALGDSIEANRFGEACYVSKLSTL
jgi:hypothetical protein